MFNSIEGDGVIENIYHLLWTKDSIFGTDPYVIIPHTILFKYQKPCYWYFTSKIDGKLKKKSTIRINNQHIREVFLKKISPSGIVAYFIYKKMQLVKQEETDILIKSTNKIQLNKSKSSDKDGVYVIEYLDVGKFDEFLNNRSAYNDGILQKFEDPKGDYNFTLRVNWSPKLCIFERNVNVKKIYDTRYDIYEKAVTYDGEEFQTKTEPIRGSNLCDRLERIGMSIASHISNITLERIKVIRMILNFKITKDDKLVFLWCSSLRIDNSLEKRKGFGEKLSELDIHKIKLHSPDHINLFKYSIYGKPLKPVRDALCLNCDSKIESHRLYEITFKTLIEAHENRKRDKLFFQNLGNMKTTSSGIEIIPYIENKNSEVKIENTNKKSYVNFIIPKLISAIYPRMKYEEYQSLQRDSIFNSKTAYVCDTCYMELTRYCDFSGSNTENILRKLKPMNVQNYVLPKPSVVANINQTTQAFFRNSLIPIKRGSII